MDINKKLDEIQARCDAATEGPWSVGGEGDYEDERALIDAKGRCMFTGESGYVGGYAEGPDVRFIAAARADLPATITALRGFSRRHHEAAMAWGGVECSCGRDRYCPDLAILRRLGEALT